MLDACVMKECIVFRQGGFEVMTRFWRFVEDADESKMASELQKSLEAIQMNLCDIATQSFIGILSSSSQRMLLAIETAQVVSL